MKQDDFPKWKITSFPFSQSPNRAAENAKEGEGISDFDLIKQCQAGLMNSTELYAHLRKLWGVVVFEGTRSCHENMKSRCKNAYAILDPEFEVLPDFLFHMGPRPDQPFSIDRINNQQGYSPENCRWADKSTQTRNRSNTITLTIGKDTLTVPEWAERIGEPASAIYKRRSMGMSDYQVVYGVRHVVLPSSEFWPPKSWDEFDACVAACARWSNDYRRKLRDEIRSRMERIERNADEFSIPEFAREMVGEKALAEEAQWTEIYLRYCGLLQAVLKVSFDRYR